MASANFDLVTLVFDPMGFADISPASLAFGFVVILHWSKFKFFQRLWKFYQTMTNVTPRGRSASVAIAGLYDALGPTAKAVGVAYEPDESVHLPGLDDASEWCIWVSLEREGLKDLAKTVCQDVKFDPDGGGSPKLPDTCLVDAFRAMGIK
ncbi:unnamed protein product, partial [Symbiodinium sp. KB8]